jgi:hypothetical protein
MPNNKLNAALCGLARLMLQESRGGFTRYAIVSSIDEEVYVLVDRAEALVEIAADMDGSCFELNAREI